MSDVNLTKGTVADLARIMAMAVELGAEKYDGNRATLAKWTGRRIWHTLPVTNLRGMHLPYLRSAFTAGWYQAEMMGKP